VGITPNGSGYTNITPCKPGVDFIFDINNYDSIIWNFGDGSKIERTGGVDLKKYFDANGVLKRNYQYFAGQYEAKFVIKNRSSGCTDTLKIPVQVNTDSTHEVKIANVFTPNGDGKNDCFWVFGIAPDCEEAEIRIFNRWGERVYYSKDLSNCWNGKVNNTGPELPSGTYFYQLDIIKSPFMKTPKHVAGSANLIR
jgi:gliding motility-associated-like protein